MAPARLSPDRPRRRLPCLTQAQRLALIILRRQPPSRQRQRALAQLVDLDGAKVRERERKRRYRAGVQAKGRSGL